MNKLSQEEMQDLLGYTASDGTIYFYSKIFLDGSVLLYNDEKYEVNDTTLKKLQDGLLNYEYYKLSMSKSDAEELLAQKATAIIEEQYTERFENMTEQFNAVLNKIEEALMSTATEVDKAMINLLDSSTALKKTTNTMSNIENSINPTVINSKVTKKLNELEEVKNDVIKLIEPVTKQADKLVKELEQLVDIKDS